MNENERTLSSFLKDLLSTPSPSGREWEAVEVFDSLFTVGESAGKIEADDHYKDKIGNSAWIMGHGEKRILFSAHIDSICGAITSISSDGILSFMDVAGMCDKSLVCKTVYILLDDGKLIKGIVGKKPIHIEYHEKDEYTEALMIEDQRIDIGATSIEEVEQLGVHAGCPVIFCDEPDLEFDINRRFIVSPTLDDKIGVYVVARIMRELARTKSDWEDKYTVIGLAATQEESGCRGVQVACHNLNPDISIDFDVTFATDGDLGIDKSKYGDIKLGGGPVISYGPDKSIRINKILCDIAKNLQLKIQYDSTTARGTNTGQIQLRSKDCETALVSIPNRYMHTPVEMCAWNDVEDIITLCLHSIWGGLL